MDRDGRLTGPDAVPFFERSGLPKSELARVWAFSDDARRGYLDQKGFAKVLAALRTSTLVRIDQYAACCQLLQHLRGRGRRVKGYGCY